jgi:hypothetical protein
MLAWAPPVGDLAAQVFRVELFQRVGMGIWNGSWYGGHYTLTYSVLFPPLAALLGPRLVGTLAVVASSYLFDRLVRDRWGELARPATLWFAAGVVTLLADGQLTFALGVAFGLASLRFLQLQRSGPAFVAAAACALSSPVAAAFLAGVLFVGAWDLEAQPRRFFRGWRGGGVRLGAASSFSPRRLSERGALPWRKTQRRDGHPLPDRTRGRAAGPLTVTRIAPNPSDRRPDVDGLTLLNQDLAQRPGNIAFVSHVRLVRLDLHQLVPHRHLVPNLLQPLQHRPLLHRVRQPRHHHVGHQIEPSNAARAACTTCSSCGIAACSSRRE